MSDSSNLPSFCLDLSRLASRVGRGPWTGVDRVEAAYLDYLLGQHAPLFGLVRTALGFVLLDRTGVEALAARFHGRLPWGAPDLLSSIFLKASPARRAVDSDLRRICIARSGRGGLGRMLARHLPAGCRYLNVGHANLKLHVFEALARVPGISREVLVHDVIPLDHPEMQRDDTVESFAARMRVVSKHADRVIYNSRTSQRTAEAHFQEFGRVPPSIVAHLGFDIPEATAQDLPGAIDPTRPFFVTIGTIEPRKNHTLLLDIWEQISTDTPADTCPQLVIIGQRGWKNEDLFARLDARPANVIELSGLDDAEMVTCLARARALLFPSFAEGFGLPPLEAAALGVPVIVHDLDVYREFLGNYPIYVNVCDIYLWQKRIMDLALKPGTDKTPERQHASMHPELPTWGAHFNKVLA
ncbi:glycosyltransferase family 4 protein [Aliiroseovarius marinus]|uniref:glycosyltransferase family 4 protein n=1 Tax=Aliiroseovarius marinus TaxID=2500159 RepID=UPI003D7C7973